VTTHARTTVFDRVVCGVDASDAGVAAARVAGRIADPHGSLTLVSARDTSIALHAGWNVEKVLEERELEALAALERGRSEAGVHHELQAKVVENDPLHALLAEIATRDATAVVVGGHGTSPANGIAREAVSSSLLHEAPCSVLVARGSVDAVRWPQRIVVGLDGSDDSASAFEAASALAERLDAHLRAVVARRDARVDLAAARRIAPACEEHDAQALELLDRASETSDLIVVGSRGFRLRALGSLSERIAQEARCSVLVVRPSWP
jgi:nucleotide-binding universal stress UspA family protein